MRQSWCSLLLGLVACGGGDPGIVDLSTSSQDLALVDKTQACATTFGQGLTNAFARADGTVLAVVPPAEPRCALPNATHLVVQLRIAGAAYRMVVDVLSNQGNPDVFYTQVDAPLVGAPWSEGWHPDARFDYVTSLSLHSGAFTAMKQADLVAEITSHLEVGAPVSVFATSENSPSSAHLVHRNKTGADGAIVVNPTSQSPHYLLLRFDEQVF